MLLIYRLLFPLVFLFFLPGLIIKLIRRPGYKKTYAERFGIFSRERRKELQDWQGAVWIHAVSVGETNLALTVLNRWTAAEPDRRFVLSTTTTTAQEIARKKAPAGTKVIFCPLDFFFGVRRVLNLLKPSALVIFETELWPNMIATAHRRGIRTALVNARISDKSFRGYRRFRFFFRPVLSAFDSIGVQTALDRDRLTEIDPALAGKLTVTGNIKFDQQPPEGPGFDYGTVFGPDSGPVIVAASTHHPEEALILSAFRAVRRNFPSARLTIVPRHAERGGEIEKLIVSAGFRCLRRSTGAGPEGVPDVLLADTTGELVRFLKSADLVIMGKTLAGNDEGQNIIEPAVMGKAIVCGPKLRNFRQAIDALKKHHAVRIAQTDDELAPAVTELISDPEKARALGRAAAETMLANRGALEKTLQILKDLLSK